MSEEFISHHAAVQVLAKVEEERQRLEQKCERYKRLIWSLPGSVSPDFLPCVGCEKRVFKYGFSSCRCHYSEKRFICSDCLKDSDQTRKQNRLNECGLFENKEGKLVCTKCQ